MCADWRRDPFAYSRSTLQTDSLTVKQTHIDIETNSAKVKRNNRYKKTDIGR